MTPTITTVPEYARLAELAGRDARRRAWVEAYEAAYRDVFDLYYRRWGDPSRRAEAADQAPALVDRIRRREARMTALFDGAGARLRAVGIDDAAFDTVLLVGVHSSNGWAVRFRGHPTVFVALEFLMDGPEDELLVLHEAVHAVHLCRGAAEPWPENVAGDLVSEGLAVAATRALIPGASDSAYLWTDDRHDEWVGRCAARDTDIRRFVFGHLERADDEPDTKGLFSSVDLPGGLPPRCGYWLGDRMVGDWLAQGRPLADVLDLSYPEAFVAARQWLAGAPLD